MSHIIVYLPDIRYLLTVSKIFYQVILQSEDYLFWSNHELTNINIMSYRLPKMLQLVNDIQGNILYANCNLNMLKQCKEVKINIDYTIMLLFMPHAIKLEVLEHLVENGANIHANNDYAIKYAIENKHYELTEYLLSIK
jgi:hypothetical protein